MPGENAPRPGENMCGYSGGVCGYAPRVKAGMDGVMSGSRPCCMGDMGPNDSGGGIAIRPSDGAGARRVVLGVDARVGGSESVSSMSCGCTTLARGLGPNAEEGGKWRGNGDGGTNMCGWGCTISGYGSS